MKPKKIILIIIDSLRADHLGCYGYKRNTSPNIDDLSKDSFLFKHAFSPSSLTIPSICSILTSKYPGNHSIGFDPHGKLDPDIDITLATILSNNNYKTAAFVSSREPGKNTDLNAGFELYDDETGFDQNGRRDCVTTNLQVMKWLEENSDQNFFLFVHYFDVHGPYVTQEPYKSEFVNDELYGEPEYVQDTFDINPAFDSIPGYQILNPVKNESTNLLDHERDVRYYKAQYDGCIKHLDYNLGELIKKLKELEIYDDSLIIVTSDHGEAHGENNIFFYHGLTVTLDQIRVPLLLKPHKDIEIKNRLIDTPVSTIDIMPTVLSLCDHDYSSIRIEGHSLTKILEDEEDLLLKDRTLVSENEGQFALVKPGGLMELKKKDDPVSSYYPHMPALIDSLNGKKFYWDSGNEYTLTIPFDQYQRYKIIADIINKFRNNEKIFKILDVGAGFEKTLKKFLPDDDIYFFDKDYPPELKTRPKFITGDITKVDLSDRYDFVISIDAYEHIHPISREGFVNKLIHLSKIATIVAAPFDTPGVHENEIFANEAYKLSHGIEYKWLHEHIYNGLPSLPFTLELIEKSGFDFTVIPNGYLPRWFEMISIFLLTEGYEEFSNNIKELNDFYSKNFYSYDNLNPSYRQVIIINKSEQNPDYSDIKAKNYENDKDFLIKIEMLHNIFKRIKELHSSYKFKELLEKNRQVAELNSALQAKEAKIIQINSVLQTREAQIKELNNVLQSIQQSMVWRATMFFNNRIIDKLLPQETGRRKTYDLALKSFKILITEGAGSLWRNYKQRRDMNQHLQQHIKKINKFPSAALENWNGKQMIFPVPSENPDVSIIIPVHNNSKYTYNCLNSILKNTQRSFEIIVIDDASSDETTELLRNVENIRVIRNDNNLGFVESCNIGAKSGKGKYLFFLNNDTIVTENWLEPLINAISKQDVGAVGAKLIYPDGKLQEAGGIIWNDASGWNYGRFDDPDKPEYNFVREVDYCSGAALIVKNELFNKIGGFDERFKPAYYEDIDLCFSIRKLGFKVLYQPHSAVIHFEGVTGGTDIKTGPKKHQELNKPKFYDKWKETLLLENHNPDAANLLFYARNKRKGKNILLIDHYVPTFDKDAGSYMVYNFIKVLSDLGHKVTFIGDNFARLEPYTSIIQQMGVEVIYSPYIKSIGSFLVEKGKFFEIVILGRAHIAVNHISNVKKSCPDSKIVFNTIDLEFLREIRRAKIENNENVLRQAEDLKKIEYNLARTCDVTLVVSPVEKEIMLKEDPSLKIKVISNIIREIKKPNTPFSKRRDIIFVGNFTHLPNIDAVIWFAKEIFPLIKEKIQDIKFNIVGDPTKEIKSLSSDDIILLGYIKDADLFQYFDNCKISIAPLRYGAGIKGKIIQSLSYGSPIITTSIGAEGLNLVDGENVLMADEPNKFAEKVVMLYENEALWNKLSKNSIEIVERKYSYDANKILIKELISDLT
ncbi:MAG: sulfatase-like hydrolase/transferase [Candidatus Methanoperedens sp.]|nr:sulfatase-like hydrolase/transferase [Candidatus Methanoperedens sp.]